MGVRKGSISYILLTILEKTVDGTVKAYDFADNPGYYAYWGGHDIPQSALSHAIRRLREGGLVEKTINDGELILKLTSKGRELITIGAEPSEWDGKWRIVIFDIPEQKRIIRNLFRNNLKKWGFKQLQKSVWISKCDVFERVENYINDLKINDWVTIIESNKISHNVIT